MSRAVYGYIPDTINIHLTDPRIHNIGTYNNHYSEEDMLLFDTKNKKLLLLPQSFIEEAGTSSSTASRWASSWSRNPAQKMPPLLKVANTPFNNIRIINSYYSGGMKVLIGTGATQYVSEIEQDTAVDIIQNSKITKGGIVHDQFIWAKIRGKIHLIRYGGEVHQKIEIYQQNRGKSKIKPKDLIPGKIYRSLSGDTAMFVSMVDTTAMFPPNQSTYHFYNDNNLNNFITVPQNKKMLFLVLPEKHVKIDKNIDFETFLKHARPEVKLTHSYVEELGQHYKIPQDIIRTIAKKIAKQALREAKKGSSKLKIFIRFKSMLLNMRPVGTDQSEAFDYNKYLNFL